MKIKINESLICIPPYISATWDRITFLQSEENPENKTFTLIIHVADGKKVAIPDLDSSLIEIAFSAHLKYLEASGSNRQVKSEPNKPFSSIFQQLTGLSPEQLSNIPIKFGIAGIPGIEGIEMAFQHNPSQAEIPEMPPEVLDKVSQFAKMMTGGDLQSFPKPEPHCNCMHCQVARAIHGIEKKPLAGQEELIEEDDLKFRDWEIVQLGENQYEVTNPLPPKEKYRVFLGSPVGCTCGNAQCEHIKAVLYS